MNRRGLAILILLCAMLLSSCGSGQQQEPLFEVTQVEADVLDQSTEQAITVFVDLNLKFTPAVEEALRKGVVITLKADTRIVHDEHITRVVKGQGHRWQIQFLPLSRHYLLTDLRSKEQTSWPRLRHALAALRGVEIVLPSVQLKPGNYRLEVMVYLDRRKLPAPLRLPALVSSAWKLKSTWYKWQFRITK